MDPSLRTAATGMRAQQLRVEVIANNLANVNTTAFKRSRAHFEDLLYQTVQGPAIVNGDGAETTEAIQIGRGTRLSAVQRIAMQGAVEATGRSLDLAIDGEGYFQLRLPDGRAGYTRDGSFTVSADGLLVNAGGYEVSPGLVIPPETTQITISASGSVSVQLSGSADPVEVGRLEMARFANDAGLEALGENILVETQASGVPLEGFPQDEGFGRVLQGHLETSNVEIVQEMVDMIAAMRAYEINSKAIKTSEDMAQISNNLIR